MNARGDLPVWINSPNSVQLLIIYQTKMPVHLSIQTFELFYSKFIGGKLIKSFHMKIDAILTSWTQTTSSFSSPWEDHDPINVSMGIWGKVQVSQLASSEAGTVPLVTNILGAVLLHGGVTDAAHVSMGIWGKVQVSWRASSEAGTVPPDSSVLGALLLHRGHECN